MDNICMQWDEGLKTSIMNVNAAWWLNSLVQHLNIQHKNVFDSDEKLCSHMYLLKIFVGVKSLWHFFEHSEPARIPKVLIEDFSVGMANFCNIKFPELFEECIFLGAELKALLRALSIQRIEMNKSIRKIESCSIFLCLRRAYEALLLLYQC